MDKDLLPSKIAYFFLFAARGSFLPFLNIFLVKAGLTVIQAGFITGFRMIISCFSSPCWNFIGDITKFNKYILWLLVTLSTTLIFPMPWISHAIDKWYTSYSKFQNCSQTSTIMFREEKICAKHSKDEVLFLALLTVNLGNALFHLPIPLYIDQMVHKLIKGKSSDCFENQRIFAALGFALAALSSGILCDYFNIDGFSEYLPLFYLYIVMIFCFVISSYPLFRVIEKLRHNGDTSPNSENNNEDREMIQQKPRKTQAFQLLVATFCNINVLLFLFSVILMGTANELTYGYIFIFIDELHGGKILMGLSIFTSSFSEFVFQKIINRFVRRVRRPLICMNIAVFVQFIRFLLLSFVQNPWLIIPIQTLHCVSYALFWSAAKKQTRMISPNQIVSAVYAFVHVLHFDFPGVFAFIGGGFLYEYFKGHLMFRWASFLYLFWTLVIIIQFVVLRREEVHRESVVEMENIEENPEEQLNVIT